MAIISKINIDQLFKDVYAKVDDITDSVIQAISAACTQTVANARSLRTYKDDTNLLRSSIGFVLYDHGEKVSENFENKGSSEGVSRGKEIATQAAQQYNDCIVAVIVAGADYALWVESKGYDVISGPCSELNNLLGQYLAAAVKSFE